MAFERKKAPQERPDQKYWNLLKAYWLIVPALFFILVLPRITESPELQTVYREDVSPLVYQSMNMGLAFVFHHTHVSERTRNGAGDKLLKVAGVQQLLSRNLFGFLFVLFVWYKLPNRVNPAYFTEEEKNQSAFQPKTLYILAGVILSITLLVNVSQFLLN